MRVSRSGAVRSAMRPHSKRLRRRSSSVVICLGGRSLREDDLLAVLVDGVEGVEELLLGALLVGDELDVVDEEQVDLPVARPEVVDATLLDAGDEVVGELLARGVHDALAREARHHGVADRVHEVRLAEAHAAVEEERVVGFAGSLRDRQAGSVGETVGRADDEGPERVAGVEVDAPALGAADATGLDAHADLDAVEPPPRLTPARPRPVGSTFADLELDVDAVAHDARQRLGDERAVAVLQPVLGEAVGCGDAETVTVDPDERRCPSARSRSWPVTATPGAHRGRRARPVSRPSMAA